MRDRETETNTTWRERGPSERGWKKVRLERTRTRERENERDIYTCVYHRYYYRPPADTFSTFLSTALSTISSFTGTETPGPLLCLLAGPAFWAARRLLGAGNCGSNLSAIGPPLDSTKIYILFLRRIHTILVIAAHLLLLRRRSRVDKYYDCLVSGVFFR